MSFDNNLYCYNSSNQRKLPITPGAYFFIRDASILPPVGPPGAYGVTGPKLFPIYGNISNFNNFNSNDKIDDYLILPGYCLIVYLNSDYSGTSDTYDNTNGTTVMYYFQGASNSDTSCKLFYGGTSASNQLGDMTYTGVAGGQVGVQVGNFTNLPYTITSNDNTILPLFPGAYFFNRNSPDPDFPVTPSSQTKVFPIYGCINNYSNFDIQPNRIFTTTNNYNVYQTYLVLPEFQLLTYNQTWTTTPPQSGSQIGPYVNYTGENYMYGISGDINNDESCTLAFKDNGPPILGLMNYTGSSQSTSWSAWSGLPNNYPGSFTNSPIFYTTPSGSQFPPTPFAWAFVWDNNSNSKAFPIYGSISSYGGFAMSDTVDAYLVLPGFCLITFSNASWNGSIYYYNNIEGSNYAYYTTNNNNNSSCLLFYKGTNNNTNLLGQMQ